MFSIISLIQVDIIMHRWGKESKSGNFPIIFMKRNAFILEINFLSFLSSKGKIHLNNTEFCALIPCNTMLISEFIKSLCQLTPRTEYNIDQTQIVNVHKEHSASKYFF